MFSLTIYLINYNSLERQEIRLIQVIENGMMLA